MASLAASAPLPARDDPPRLYKDKEDQSLMATFSARWISWLHTAAGYSKSPLDPPP